MTELYLRKRVLNFFQNLWIPGECGISQNAQRILWCLISVMYILMKDLFLKMKMCIKFPEKMRRKFRDRQIQQTSFSKFVHLHNGSFLVSIPSGRPEKNAKNLHYLLFSSCYFPEFLLLYIWLSETVRKRTFKTIKNGVFGWCFGCFSFLDPRAIKR